MSIRLHRALERTTMTIVAVTLGIGLFATGVWAGSTRGGSERPAAAQALGSFWSYDPRTGNLTGPAGEPDFWNYDPETGAKVSDYSPGVEPEHLAALWSVER